MTRIIAMTAVLLLPVYGGVKTISTYNRNAISLVRMPSTNGFDKLITDDQLVNTYYNLAQTIRFLDSYKGSLLTAQEKADIYNAAKRWHINILALCAKIELESAIISWGCGYSRKYEYRKAWCLGAGMYTTVISNGKYIKPYVGYTKQLDHGAYTLRKHYNAWTNGARVRINEGMHYVTPRNAATYALYKYTPYWGTWRENGVVCSGQEYFIVVYNRMKQRWSDVNK